MASHGERGYYIRARLTEVSSSLDLLNTLYYMCRMRDHVTLSLSWKLLTFLDRPGLYLSKQPHKP